MRKLIELKHWRSLVCIMGLLAGLFGSFSRAHAQTDAYSVQVAVLDRSDAEQKNAYEVGMRVVLLSNSGDKTLLNRDDVRAGLRAADTYVESFRYDAPAPGTVITRDTPLTDAVRKSGKATQFMLIQFDRVLINELIRPQNPAPADTTTENEAFNPFANVSSALMWLIIEDDGKQVLVSGASAQNVMERAREIAGGASISLSFPAGDDKDTQAISADDIKTGNLDLISAAASRYAQPLTLAAHMKRTRTGAWEGVWIKSSAGQKENQVFNAGSLDQGLQQGIAWLNPQSFDSATQPALQSAPRATTSNVEGLVWVSPLRNTKSYAEVIDLLSSLDGVVAAYPKEVLSGGMVFAIVPRSALPAVANAAATTAWLRQAATPSSASQSRFVDGISASYEYVR